MISEILSVTDKLQWNITVHDRNCVHFGSAKVLDHFMRKILYLLG